MEKILQSLGLSGGAIRVFSVLVESKEASAKRLADLSGIARTSVYDYLSELKKLGLVVELDIENKKVFRPDDPNNLLVLIEKRKKDILESEKELKKNLPKLSESLSSGEPKIKFYTGDDSLSAVLAEVLRSGVKEVLFLWPFSEMTSRIGEQELSDFTYRRVNEGIAVRSIYPFGTKHALQLKNEKTKVAQKDCKWDMGAVIFGNKVAFISSRKESYAFVVNSKDFADLQRTLFEQIWKSSNT